MKLRDEINCIRLPAESETYMKIYALVLSLCILGVASVGMAAGPGSGGGGAGHGGSAVHGGGSGYAGGVRPGSHGGAVNSFAATSNGLAGSSSGAGPTVVPQRGFGALPTQRNKALMTLRAEGLRIRQQDGGKLTQEHRAALQARLNRINGVPSTAH